MHVPRSSRSAVRLSVAVVAVVAVWLALVAMTGVALGHGGEPAALSVTPQALRPGAVAEVSGADFAPGSEIAIEVSSGRIRLALSTVMSDEEGHFFDAVQLPGDLAGGFWEIRARDAAGTWSAAAIAVEGDPAGSGVADGGAGGASGWDPADLVIPALVALVALGALAVVVGLVRRGTPSIS